MFLELKAVQDYLHVQLRNLQRTAKKKNIEVFLMCSGVEMQSITVTTSNIGPFQEKTHFSLMIYACKDNHFSHHRMPFNIHQAIDVEKLMFEIEEHLQNASVVVPPIEDVVIKFNQSENVSVDDAMINSDIQELIDWFRARYVIDAPRKILYYALLSRGFEFNAFMHEKTGFIFHSKSFCNSKVKMRTRLCNLVHSSYANSMRQLRLNETRIDLFPFWNAEVGELNQENLPQIVILSANVLAKLAHANLINGKFNEDMWDWLKLFDNNEAKDRNLLNCIVEEVDHPVIKKIKSNYQNWYHPKGVSEVTLKEVLNELETPYEEFIYIHDAEISIERNSIDMTSIGSSLHIIKNAKSKIINQSIYLEFDSEVMQSAQKSTHSRIMQTQSRTIVEVPQYLELTKDKIKRLKLLN